MKIFFSLMSISFSSFEVRQGTDDRFGGRSDHTGEIFTRNGKPGVLILGGMVALLQRDQRVGYRFRTELYARLSNRSSVSCRLLESNLMNLAATSRFE